MATDIELWCGSFSRAFCAVNEQPKGAQHFHPSVFLRRAWSLTGVLVCFRNCEHLGCGGSDDQAVVQTDAPEGARALPDRLRVRHPDRAAARQLKLKPKPNTASWRQTEFLSVWSRRVLSHAQYNHHQSVCACLYVDMLGGGTPHPPNSTWVISKKKFFFLKWAKTDSEIMVTSTHSSTANVSMDHTLFRRSLLVSICRIFI